MNVGDDSSQVIGQRKAALMLVAMAPTDREWVMGQLTPLQRAGIEAMVAELHELGMTGDPGLLREAIAPSSISTKRVEDIKSVHQTSLLEHVPHTAIMDVLGAEPPAVVALLLCSRPWPWRDVVLQQMAAHKRRQVQDALEPAGLGEAQTKGRADLLQRVLVEEFVRRATLSQGAPAERGLSRSIGWGQVCGGINRWVRRFVYRLPIKTRIGQV